MMIYTMGDTAAALGGTFSLFLFFFLFYLVIPPTIYVKPFQFEDTSIYEKEFSYDDLMW